ncbi:hypothetical protein [Tepidibacillus marianensis]|uniref:hypothetical protein n=1 Tax=Tepidibacillus marianensis TaxID=3131995 RepID=UPI0030CC59F2
MKIRLKERFLSTSLRSKLWFTIITIILFSGIFNYWLTLFLYEHLYVEQTQKQLEVKGKELVGWYTGGEISQSFKDKIDMVSSVSIEKIAIASHPQDVAACLPVNHPPSVTSPVPNDKWDLLKKGQTISFIGEHETVKRDVIAVAVPLIDPNTKEIKGGLFLYEPLATVTEAVSEIRLLLAMYLAFFSSLGLLLLKLLPIP